jgi:hypothetical protein
MMSSEACWNGVVGDEERWSSSDDEMCLNAGEMEFFEGGP